MKKIISPTILCLRSNRWASMLGREFAERNNLRWALDIDDMIFEAKPCVGAACVIELDSQSTDFAQHCHQLNAFSNNSASARLFVVGDCGLFHWRAALRQVGVAMTCTLALDVSALIRSIQRHHNGGADNLVSIETWTEQNLPWSVEN